MAGKSEGEGLVTRAEAEAMAEAAAQRAVSAALEMLAARPNAARGETTDQTALARELAVAIQGLTDSNSRVKRLSPTEIERRVSAKARMDALLAEAQGGKGDVPEYVLKHPCFLGEQFIEPTEVGPDRVLRAKRVRWTGAPNQAMRPVNETAAVIWNAFNESIGGTMRVDDEKLRVGAGGLVVVGQAGVPVEKARLESRLAGAPWQTEREVLEVVGRTVPGEFVPAPVMPGAHPARVQHTSRAA